MYYLYIKTHNKTGLKYLGFTAQDPYKYKGSGLHWKRHLSKHGSDISTTILLETNNKNEIKEKGIFYSELWNIKDSDEWANLTKEEGTGGAINQGRKHSEESIQKMKKIHKGKIFTDQHKQNLSTAHLGKCLGEDNGFYGKHHTEETKQKISASLAGKTRTEEFKQNLSKLYLGKPKPKIICPHCNKEGGLPQMKRYHFDNCKRRNKMS